MLPLANLAHPVRVSFCTCLLSIYFNPVMASPLPATLEYNLYVNMDCMVYYLAFFLSIFLVIKLLFQRNNNLPPGPLSLPIIGHFHLLSPPLHKTLAGLSKKYGPIVTVKLGSRYIFAVSSLSVAEECFMKNDLVLANRPPTMFGRHWSYNYNGFIFASYGHLWRALRRLAVTELFSRSYLDRSTAIAEEARDLLRLILSKVSDGGDKKLELNYFFAVNSANVMMKMNAGKKWIDQEKAAVIETGTQCLEDIKKKFPPSADFSLLDFLPFLKWFGFKWEEERFIKVYEERDRFLQGLIEDVRGKKTGSVSNSTAAGVNDRTTVIGSILAHQKSDPQLYSDDAVKGTLATIYVAGADVVYTTKEWVMTNLLNHPEKLQKVREEIDREVGHERLVEESDFPKLNYLRCVLNETLRLYPAAPVTLPHSPSEDCIIGGYKIPRGTSVIVNIYAIHRDPKLWEEPEIFKPERFEGINEGEKKGFIPFGIGRRSCPGNYLAMRRVMMPIAVLIQCFEWERVGKELIDTSTAKAFISMAKAKPLEAICTPRPLATKLIPQL